MDGLCGNLTISISKGTIPIKYNQYSLPVKYTVKLLSLKDLLYLIQKTSGFYVNAAGGTSSRGESSES